MKKKLEPKIRFERPHFITPHAIEQFQKRVVNMSASEVILLVQAALQVRRKPEWSFRRRDGSISRVYKAKFEGIDYFIPVVPGKGEWPMVPTILGPDMARWLQNYKEGKPDGRKKQDGRKAV